MDEENRPLDEPRTYSFLFLVRVSSPLAFHHLIEILGKFLAGLVGHAFSHLFGPSVLLSP
jgi:hypothetical protein